MKIEARTPDETLNNSSPSYNRKDFKVGVISLIVITSVLVMVFWVMLRIVASYNIDSLEVKIAQIDNYTNMKSVDFMLSEVTDFSYPELARDFQLLVNKFSRRNIPYKLYMADLDMINAFALPGGAVVVTKKLVEKIDHKESIMMVLAHELGHHEYKHVAERLLTSIGLSLPLLVLGDSAPASMVAEVVNVGLLGFSRSQEEEADKFAVKVIDALGYQRSRAFKFYEYIAEQEKNGKIPASGGIFNTHPGTLNRLEFLKSEK